MEFCNKGMVWADPPLHSYGQIPYFYIFLGSFPNGISYQMGF